jgi:hypothetical protein
MISSNTASKSWCILSTHTITTSMISDQTYTVGATLAFSFTDFTVSACSDASFTYKAE